MDLETIQDDIVTWVKAITHVDAVVWMDQPRPWHNGVIVLLDNRSAGGFGVDDITQVYDDTPGSETITRSVQGQRWIEMSMHVQSYDQRGGLDAMAIAMMAKSRARFPSSKKLLRDANLAVSVFRDPQKSDYTFDGHAVSRYVVDIRLLATSTVADAPIETIERLSGTAHVDGNDIPFEAP